MRSIIGILLFISASIIQAQDISPISEELPYASIPDYSESYTAGAVAARVADGLGFRYYWATDSLRQEDLAFKPNAAARTTEETLDHIYQLTAILKKAVLQQAYEGTPELANMSFENKRAITLNSIKVASDILKKSSEEQLATYKIIFKRTDGSSTEYPFWNMLNGPIADAIWHVGQVVTFRRSSGNPFNSKVSVLTGTLKPL